MVERAVAERETRLVYSTGDIVKNDDAPSEDPRPRKVSHGVRISLDRRASGRLVTSIRGLTGTLDDLAALARTLKAACGAGGSVKERVLELQGDHREAVEQLLARRGVRSKRAGGQ